MEEYNGKIELNLAEAEEILEEMAQMEKRYYKAFRKPKKVNPIIALKEEWIADDTNAWSDRLHIRCKEAEVSGKTNAVLLKMGKILS